MGNSCSGHSKGIQRQESAYQPADDSNKPQADVSKEGTGGGLDDSKGKVEIFDEPDAGILKNKTEIQNGDAKEAIYSADDEKLQHQLDIAEFNASLHSKTPIGSEPGKGPLTPSEAVISFNLAKKTDSLPHKIPDKKPADSLGDEEHVATKELEEPVKMRRKPDADIGGPVRTPLPAEDLRMMPPMDNMRLTRSMENLISDRLYSDRPPQGSPRGSPRASPRGSPRASPRGSPRASPRGSPHGSTSDLRFVDRDVRGRPVSWVGGPQGVPQGMPREYLGKSPRGSPRGSTGDLRNMYMDPRGRPVSWGGSPRASPRASPMPSPRASPRASPRGTPRGSTSDLRTLDVDGTGRPLSWGGGPPGAQRRGSSSSQTSQERRRIEHLQGIRVSKLPEGFDMLTYQLPGTPNAQRQNRRSQDLTGAYTGNRRSQSMEDMLGTGRRQPWEGSPGTGRRKKPMGIWARTQAEGS